MGTLRCMQLRLQQLKAELPYNVLVNINGAQNFRGIFHLASFMYLWHHLGKLC